MEIYNVTGLIFAISFAVIVLVCSIIGIAFTIDYLRRKK